MRCCSSKALLEKPRITPKLRKSRGIVQIPPFLDFSSERDNFFTQNARTRRNHSL